MSSLATRIRAKASRKEIVSITRRKKSKHGFLITDPDGLTERHPTKREALQAMFAKVRCAPVRKWYLSAVLSEKGGES